MNELVKYKKKRRIRTGCTTKTTRKKMTQVTLYVKL